MKKQRDNFSSKLGFVLATAGSAVGLGNLWRFPYLAAKYGGGIFLLTYLILAVTFGFTLMISEVALGRRTRLSGIPAFAKLDKRFTLLGYLTFFIPLIIFPYYCVIGGWVTKYLAAFVGGNMKATTGATYFTDFISSNASPVFFMLIFLAITFTVIIMGVQKGVEKVSTILMPILVLMIIFICIFTMMQPGAIDGIIYYLMPNFSDFSASTVLAALGQLFYSMSLAMGIMITYGSYMKKEEDLESSVTQVELFDTAIAFLAGLMIVPAVYVFSGGDQSAMQSGPGLMFITLPSVFNSMKFGSFIGAFFFILVFFAALTSSISLMETLVSMITDRFNTKRIPTAIGFFIFAIIFGIPSSLGFGVWSHITILGYSILDFWDFISNSVLMPISAFLTCIFVGYILKPNYIIEEVESSGQFKRKGIFSVMIRYIAPICIIAILLCGLGIFKI
ncbi:MAG: sodium-dependent transporter [Lachnospiraceae bacterium]|nr:sodium-dependent transporter [Lachnospiraceae bacterium]